MVGSLSGDILRGRSVGRGRSERLLGHDRNRPGRISSHGAEGVSRPSVPDIVLKSGPGVSAMVRLSLTHLLLSKLFPQARSLCSISRNIPVFFIFLLSSVLFGPRVVRIECILHYFMVRELASVYVLTGVLQGVYLSMKPRGVSRRPGKGEYLDCFAFVMHGGTL